jgi:hypothetical protein
MLLICWSCNKWTWQTGKADYLGWALLPRGELSLAYIIGFKFALAFQTFKEEPIYSVDGETA